MSNASGLSEQVLSDLERRKDPESIASLVRTIREQQRELDQLRMSLEVARRDREELRAALMGAQERLAELQQDQEGEQQTDS